MVFEPYLNFLKLLLDDPMLVFIGKIIQLIEESHAIMMVSRLYADLWHWSGACQMHGALPFSPLSSWLIANVDLAHVILLVNTSSSRLHPIVMGSQRNNGSILEWQTCKELRQQHSMEPFFLTHFDLTLASGDKDNKAVMKERLYILLECDLH